MIGSGNVGLVSGARFADFGHQVVRVDKDASKIDRLNDGVIPIYGSGIDQLVAKNAAAGRLSFTTDPSGPVSEADVVFIGVDTLTRHGAGFADLSNVHATASEIA